VAGRGAIDECRKMADGCGEHRFGAKVNSALQRKRTYTGPDRPYTAGWLRHVLNYIMSGYGSSEPARQDIQLIHTRAKQAVRAPLKAPYPVWARSADQAEA
jgi:hypothetical protein